jgi:hypothetical protein
MRKIALLLVFSLILFSCEKGKQSPVENTDISLIRKILIEGKLFKEFEYNDANLLSAEKTKFHYTSHHYNDENKLTTSEFYMDPAMWSSSSLAVEESMNRKEWVNPENTEKSLTQDFDYDSKGLLKRKTYIRPLVNDSEYLEYTWENNRINRQSMYWKDELSGYIDYFYDESGNLIKQVKYRILESGNTELSTTTEYEFDNMHNPFKAFKRLITPGVYTNPNNIIKETYTIHFEVDQWTQKVQVTNNSYEYDHRGYPVKVNGEAEYVYK